MGAVNIMSAVNVKNKRSRSKWAGVGLPQSILVSFF